MSERLQIEEYVDFRTAAARARKLAMDCGECVSVRRTRDGWAVLASHAVSGALDSFLAEQDDPAEREPEDEYEQSNLGEEEYQHDVLRPLMQELESDRDSWARSKEDGWFYDDDD